MTTVEFTERFIPDVLALQDLCFADGWNERMMRSAFKGGRYFGYCVYNDEKLCGFITYTVGYDDCDIEGVAVLSEYRRCGIARNLVELVIGKAKERNLFAIFLEVRESNTPARSLYASAGFSEISVRKKYYADGENAVVMKKEI